MTETPTSELEYVGTVFRAVLHTDVQKSSVQFEKDSIKASVRINRDLAAMDEVANQHGGIVERDTGDGRIFLFERAANALVAAIAMQDLTLASNAKRANGEPAIYHRIGAHVGSVVLVQNQAGGRLVRKYTGEPIVIAARLQQLCPVGDVLMSQEFMEASRDAKFLGELRHFGKQNLRNLSEPVDVYVAKVGRITEEPLRATATVKHSARDIPNRPREWVRPVILWGIFLGMIIGGWSTWQAKSPTEQAKIGHEVRLFFIHAGSWFHSPSPVKPKKASGQIASQIGSNRGRSGHLSHGNGWIKNRKEESDGLEKDVVDSGPTSDPELAQNAWKGTAQDGELEHDLDENDAILGRDPANTPNGTLSELPASTDSEGGTSH